MELEYLDYGKNLLNSIKKGVNIYKNNLLKERQKFNQSIGFLIDKINKNKEEFIYEIAKIEQKYTEINNKIENYPSNNSNDLQIGDIANEINSYFCLVNKDYDTFIKDTRKKLIQEIINEVQNISPNEHIKVNEKLAVEDKIKVDFVNENNKNNSATIINENKINKNLESNIPSNNLKDNANVNKSYVPLTNNSSNSNPRSNNQTQNEYFINKNINFINIKHSNNFPANNNFSSLNDEPFQKSKIFNDYDNEFWGEDNNNNNYNSNSNNNDKTNGTVSVAVNKLNSDNNNNTNNNTNDGNVNTNNIVKNNPSNNKQNDNQFWGIEDNLNTPHNNIINFNDEYANTTNTVNTINSINTNTNNKEIHPNFKYNSNFTPTTTDNNQKFITNNKTFLNKKRNYSNNLKNKIAPVLNNNNQKFQKKIENNSYKNLSDHEGEIIQKLKLKFPELDIDFENVLDYLKNKISATFEFNQLSVITVGKQIELFTTQANKNNTNLGNKKVDNDYFLFLFISSAKPENSNVKSPLYAYLRDLFKIRCGTFKNNDIYIGGMCTKTLSELFNEISKDSFLTYYGIISVKISVYSFLEDILNDLEEINAVSLFHNIDTKEHKEKKNLQEIIKRMRNGYEEIIKSIK